MITIVGTGHIFNIAEPLMFIIKQIWPDAVLVELDVSRFRAMTMTEEEIEKAEGTEAPWIYRNTAKYQKRMADEYGSNVGNDMLTAVNTGKLVGADIGFIDMDAAEVMNSVWTDMPFFERMRYTLSMFRDRIAGKKEIDRTIEDFGRDEDSMMADMRRRYPTLVRKLIDERNIHMADGIRMCAETHKNIVVVVGDAHVEGLFNLLDGNEMRKIRLNDLLDEERSKVWRSELWNRKDEGNES